MLEALRGWVTSPALSAATVAAIWAVCLHHGRLRRAWPPVATTIAMGMLGATLAAFAQLAFALSGQSPPYAPLALMPLPPLLAGIAAALAIVAAKSKQDVRPRHPWLAATGTLTTVLWLELAVASAASHPGAASAVLGGIPILAAAVTVVLVTGANLISRTPSRLAAEGNEDDRAGRRLAAVAGLTAGNAELPVGLSLIAVTRIASQAGGDLPATKVAIGAGTWVAAAAIFWWVKRRPGLPGRVGLGGAFALAGVGAGATALMGTFLPEDVVLLGAAFAITGLAPAFAYRFRSAAMVRYTKLREEIEVVSHRWSLIPPAVGAPVGIVTLRLGSWALAAGIVALVLVLNGVLLAMWRRTTGEADARDADAEDYHPRRVLLSATGRRTLVAMFAVGYVYYAIWATVQPELEDGFGSAAGEIVAGFVVIRVLVLPLAGWAARRAKTAPRLAALPGGASLVLAACLAVFHTGGHAPTLATLGWVLPAALAAEIGRQVILSAKRVTIGPLRHTAAVMATGALYAGFGFGFLVAGWAARWLAAALVWLAGRPLVPALAPVALLAIVALIRVRRRTTPLRAYIKGDFLDVQFTRDNEPGLTTAYLTPTMVSRGDCVLAETRTTITGREVVVIDRPIVDGGQDADHRLTERTLVAWLAFLAFPQWLAPLLPTNGRVRWWLPLFPIFAEGRLVGVGVWFEDPHEFRYSFEGRAEPDGESGGGALKLRSPALPGAAVRERRDFYELAA